MALQMIRDGVESSFGSADRKKVELPLGLSMDSWNEVRSHVRASWSLRGLQFEFQTLGEQFSVVVIRDHSADHAAKPLHCVASGSGADGNSTPKSKPKWATSETPIKEKDWKRVAKAPKRQPEAPSKQSKAKNSRTVSLLNQVVPREVPPGSKGILAVKAGLSQALAAGDSHELLAWLKGLGRMPVERHELQGIGIGEVIRSCWKFRDPLVRKLAIRVAKRHGWEIFR